LVIDRSAVCGVAGLTVVLVVLELLLVSGSGVLLWKTLAVLVNVPAAVGVTVIVTVTDAPTANVPILHVTVPLVKVHVPVDAPVHDAPPKITPAGRGSVTYTTLDVLGPAFATRSVYVRVCPTCTGSGEALLMIDRSEGLTNTYVPTVSVNVASVPDAADTEPRMYTPLIRPMSINGRRMDRCLMRFPATKVEKKTTTGKGTHPRRSLGTDRSQARQNDLRATFPTLIGPLGPVARATS
jgi:hypothetical protein